MRSSFIIFLALYANSSFSQTKHLQKFYPENTLYKKLRIRQVIDSFRINPYTVWISEYDSLGRELGGYYDTYKNWDNPFRYQNINDTLYRLKYKENNRIYSFEMFVYSKSRKILKYVECRESYTGDYKNQVYVNDFFYDSRENLYCQIEYNHFNYPHPVRERMSIETKNLNISDVIYYSYKKTRTGLVIIAKHAIGEPELRRTDTLLYNSANQLIKESSFAKHGFIGELARDNLNRVEENHIKVNEITAFSYYIYCWPPLINGKCLHPKKSELDKRQIIFHKNGLIKEEYSFQLDGQRYLLSKYSYTYHQEAP